jgi:hypothetical protein
MMEKINGINANPAIDKAFFVLYALLLKEQTIESEECLGFVAMAQALWLNEYSE